MCFRPAEISMNNCPECGAANKPIAKVCASCGADLEMVKVDMDADQAALDANNRFMGASGAPGVFGAPAAPVAPVAPGAPGPAAQSQA